MSLTGMIMPALMILIGIAMIVRTLTGGGSPVAIGILVGVLFVAAGAGRIFVGRRVP
jgi:hypothetical protein